MLERILELKFINEITVENITDICSMLLVIVGGGFAYYQWKRSVALKRAEFINELTEKIRTDEYIRDVLYLFDYDEYWYSIDFHDSGVLELKVDKTLSYFSYICYLKKQRLISNKEFRFFEYEVDRILENEQVQDYFYNLYHFCDKKTSITFQYLFEYGEKHKMFDDAFYRKDSYKNNKKYHRYLNF